MAKGEEKAISTPMEQAKFCPGHRCQTEKGTSTWHHSLEGWMLLWPGPLRGWGGRVPVGPSPQPILRVHVLGKLDPEEGLGLVGIWLPRPCGGLGHSNRDHGLWWKGAWAHKWHVPNFTSHVEAGSRAAGKLLGHLHITAGQGHQRPSTSVLQMSDIQGSRETGFSMSSQRSIRSGFADPSVIWHQHHCWHWPALCVFAVSGFGEHCAAHQLSPMALFPVSWALCQWHHQSGIVWNGSAKAAPTSSNSGQARISTPKDRLLRQAFRWGRRASEEGCRAAEHTTSFSTSELACFSLSCKGPHVGRRDVTPSSWAPVTFEGPVAFFTRAESHLQRHCGQPPKHADYFLSP